MKVRGIILDFDNTLYHADEAYSRSLEKVDIKPDSLVYSTAREKVKSRLGRNHPCSHNRLLYFKQLLDSENRFSPCQLMSLMTSYETALQAEIRLQWESLGRDLLFTDLARECPLLLLTNENTRTQLLKLVAVDPDGKYFKGIITSEEFGFEKPDERLFNYAADFLQVSPSDCLYVGDDLEKDIIPAVHIGFQTFWTLEFNRGFVTKKDLCPPLARIIHQLDELRGFL